MLDLNIHDIHKKVDQGLMSYEMLTAFYLKRIEALNDQVNAVSELNPKALDQAKALDLEYKSKGRRSDLHGIPIMIKDNINIKGDGFHTTAGAMVFRDLEAPYDATIVRKLKDSGALILGKTNLSEFANFISEDSPNGFSALKGQVVNPYGGNDVGGSSSGSGVAVTLGFCQAAIGTETSGSIISPSSLNSIIGLKPTIGTASRYGIIPISSTQDVPGPMARHLEDIKVLQSVIEGFDSKDRTTKELLKQFGRDWKKPLQRDTGSMRLGIYVNQDYKNDRLAANNHFAKAVNRLTEAGISSVPLALDKDLYNINWDVLYYEFPVDMAAYLKSMGDSVAVSSLLEILVFNEADMKINVPYDQRQFEIAVNKQETYEEGYEQALKDSFSYGSVIEDWLESHKLDAVCSVYCDATDMAARIGLPSLTIPIGYDEEGVPTGFTLTGRAFSEPLLCAIAEALMPIIHERKQLFEELED